MLHDERTDAQIAEIEEWAVATYGSVSVRFTEGVKGRTKRRYMVSVDGQPEQNWPSVTSVIGKHFEKGGLAMWAELETIKGCAALIENVETLEELPTDPKKLGGALYAMGQTPNQIRDAAGLQGNTIHQAVEDWFNHGQVPDLSLVPAEKRGKMQALAAFLIDVRPKFIASEPPIVSLTHQYTGRPDLLATCEGNPRVPIQVAVKKGSPSRMGWMPEGTVLFDFKSGNSIHQDMGVQLGMYEQGLNECGFPDVDWRIVVHLKDDGYALHAFPDSRPIVPHLMGLYRTFLSINKAKTNLNRSLLLEPEPAEAVA
jgi:hypothetical protein